MNLPVFALYVLPVFGVLIALEALWFRHVRRDYPWRDSLASLGVWVGRILAGIGGTAFILLVYTAVWEVTPLRMPLDNVGAEAMKGGFQEKRGSRPHEAADLLAPRNTPVHAVQGGTIAKLFFSKAGGITIYQFDPTETYCYYYAHLERYAEGLKEGAPIKRGEVIGYVGTTGNAPRDTPHLHFAIFKLTDEKRWWQGTPLDPYSVLK